MKTRILIELSADVIATVDSKLNTEYGTLSRKKVIETIVAQWAESQE